MADILGLGMTHYPGMMAGAPLAGLFRRTLAHPSVSAERKDPATWPAALRDELEHNASAEAEHRSRHLAAFRTLRSALDRFNPDVVLIWGDDQYENFRETIIPPFCTYIFDELTSRPFERFGEGAANLWDVPANTELVVKGHRDAAMELVSGLLDEGFDMAYAYQPSLPSGLGHAHVNSIVFLDVDRRGFQYPVIPVAMNSYGRSVISHHGFVRFDNPSAPPDPPSPSPRRCFELGRATARILKDSPYRAVLIASASWSHAFLTDKNAWLYPDVDADQARLAELKANQFHAWRDLTLSDIEEAGHQEFLNWVCLAGAMTELGAKSRLVDYVESYTFNSNKAFAIFEP
jgi:Catalytic LigB subunit of aromatic ring-opening dioxygenase